MESQYRAFWENKMWEVLQIDYRTPQTVRLTDRVTDHINVPLEDVILMLNTGKKDISGECVYEGDFIESHQGTQVLDIVMQVKYGTYQAYCPTDDDYMDNVGFYVEAEGYPQMPLGPTEEYAKVIGNVHEDLDWAELAMPHNNPHIRKNLDSDCLKRIISKNITLLTNEEYSNNGNMLILGASGTGKDFNVKLPNIALADAESKYPGSMVIMDDKGEILNLTGRMFEDRGYRIKIIDFSILKDKKDDETIELFEHEHLSFDWTSLGTGIVDGKENIKTAVFLVNPPFSTSRDYESSAEKICIAILKSLYEVFLKNGRLSVPVTFWAESDAPYFFTDNVITECLKFGRIKTPNIYFCFSLQNIDILEHYGKECRHFIEIFCDNLVVTGCNSPNSCKYVSEMCGTDNYGRLYFTQNEVYNIKSDECLVLMRGEKPRLDKKYDTRSTLFYEEYLCEK